MFKLMKYEFRKQAFSKLIMVLLAILVEIAFTYGMITSSEERIATAFGLLSALAVGSILFVSFECVLTYSNELKTKTGYMLFMVPHSTYTVIGAKVLSTIVQIILTTAAFAAVAIADFGALIAKYESFSEAFKAFQEMLNVNIDIHNVTLGIAVVAVTWISIVILAFFSVTLSTTFLANKRGKGVVSFGIFLVIYYAFNKLTSLIFGNVALMSTGGAWLMIAVTAIFTCIVYIGTAYMLDRKVSL